MRESLGFVKKVQKSTFFYKSLPTTLVESEEKLGLYNISLENYERRFVEVDELLTSGQKEKQLFENHPQQEAVRNYLIENTESLDNFIS